jgi:hypothetical protein
MGQSFGNQFTLVEVATDAAVRGIARKELWVAAAKPEQALTLVLSAIPEGWAVGLSGEIATPEQQAHLKPGEVRKLTN